MSHPKKDVSAEEGKRKDTQDALQNENRVLQEMLNHPENMHIVFLDRDFNFVRVNEAYAKTCGYKPEEMIGKNHFELYPDEEVEAIFRRVRETGTPATFHDRPFVFPDQPERGVTYWDWTLKPVKNEAGKVTGLVFSLVETTERKKTEEEIQNLAKFPSENPSPVLRIHKNCCFLYCNNAAKQSLTAAKCSIGRAIPKNWRTPVDTAFTSGKRQEFEERVGEKTFVFTVSPVTDYVNVYGHDITERKRAEENLRKSEQRYRSYIELTGELGWTTNAKGEVIEDISSWRNYTGQTWDEIQGSGWSKALHPDDLENTLRTWTQATREKSKYEMEYRIRRYDGVYRHFLARGVPVFDEKGAVREWVGTCIDITERRKAQEILMENNVAIESAPDAIFSTNNSFLIKSWNRAAESIFGWTAQEVVGKATTSIFNTKYPTLNGVTREQALKRLMNTGFWKGEVLYHKKSGLPIPVSVSVSLVKDKGGNTSGMVAVVHDISKRKRRIEALKRSLETAKRRAEDLETLQAKLEQKAAEVQEYATHMEELAEERAMKLKDAERLAAIGATAGMVGHDIRNPLQAIMGDLFLVASDVALLPECEEKESIKESIAAIRKSIEYINKIVQDLQDFAKSQKPDVRPVDLEEILQNLFAKKDFPENISAKYQVEEDAKKILADPALLERIIRNLEINAVQAMPKGGKLQIHSRRENGDVVLTVQDSGVGIPANCREKLFQPLFTTKSKGQGFGLAVVKRLTEAMGGTVDYESKVDEGTKFIIRIPQKEKNDRL